MDEEFGFDLEHLLFKERKCRVCGDTKDLVNEFYLIRKNKRNFRSHYKIIILRILVCVNFLRE